VTHRSHSLFAAFALWFAATSAHAGILIEGSGLAGGIRWDAAPRTINGNERSLDGGLRYSLQGGSYQAFRDLLNWNTVPSVADFQLAVEQAFSAWTTVDPDSGLHTDVTFVADLETAVVGSGAIDGHNANGAEIDLLALNGGSASTFARVGYESIGESVILTTGGSYTSSSAISGMDITFNNHPSAVLSSLDIFRRLLTHEIGHTLGLHDVETANAQSVFIDDNYDASTAATAAATLHNSWALSVNPFDPSQSDLNLYTVVNGSPGLDSPGVNLLMESQGLGVSIENPAWSLVPLTNDEYAMRQFLYPSRERGLAVNGDYNGNGMVDVADYVVWRDSFGETVWWYGAGADGDQSGTIDQGDYDFWKARFGNMISPEVPPASLAAPEPTAWLLAAVMSLIVGATESRRWHRRSWA
jgi:hypothetical protein